jgi:hypothetical protein
MVYQWQRAAVLQIGGGKLSLFRVQKSCFSIFYQESGRSYASDAEILDLRQDFPKI